MRMEPTRTRLETTSIGDDRELPQLSNFTIPLPARVIVRSRP